MSKLKILQIITKADWAGAQRVVYELCKYIKADYFNEIEIEVAVGDDGLLVHKLRELGIKVHVLDWLKYSINPRIDYKGYKELKGIISKGGYDIVHCHSSKAGILGRLAAYRLKVKKIMYTVHGFWPILQFCGLKRRVFICIERMLVKISTDIVFISKADVEMAKEFKLYHLQKSSLIYNSITIPKVVNRVLKSEINIKEDTRIIGNVARVNKVKNPLRFIEIAHEYYHLYPKENTIFVWIGDGPIMEQAKLLVRKYKITDKVLFIGFRDNVEQYMADFDMLLMTSDWEGIPIAILEAIALNIMILSSNVGGISEMVGKKNVYQLNETNQDIAKKLNNHYPSIHFANYRMAEKYVKQYLL